MLDKEFKEKWIAALRSGEYQQGIGELCNSDNKYCCLGVAAHLCGVTGHDLSSEWISHELAYKFNIPHILVGWIGEAESLALMNDEGLSFIQIADYIEDNL